MNVLMINGSPHKTGCVYTALVEVGKALQKNNVDYEIFHIGTKPVHGCIACNACYKLGKCIFDDDPANTIQQKLKEADGFIVGSPVYYAGPNGALCALLDRIFYSATDPSIYRFKPSAAVASARRAGTPATIDRLNKYFTISRMPIVSSNYWNAVHGFTPEDVMQDEEGLQTMRTLGYNMAWMLKSIKEGNQPLPEIEQTVRTHFIKR
ncbi:flavodoxin family protein [Treponema phagedenis]|uniref:flavodoxin family protein n=1 Tax=Treponema phagedenis TaxID=162 RepID=UPI000463CD5C|nr:flavodoxin family protein [Treponema phagedenis]